MTNDEAWEAHCQAQEAEYERRCQDATCYECNLAEEYERADGTSGRLCIENMFELKPTDTPRTFDCEVFSW